MSSEQRVQTKNTAIIHKKPALRIYCQDTAYQRIIYLTETLNFLHSLLVAHCSALLTSANSELKTPNYASSCICRAMKAASGRIFL